ncbi:MAG: copper-binding protein [Planctomycetota bacterium]|nr:MAG: copper-binding protein [Planctomycetota bacterium]
MLFSTVAVVALASLHGCNKPAADAPAETAEATGAAHTYTVRGQIVSVPSADKPLADLEIHHEAIPDFKNREGVVFENPTTGVRGMKSMTMAFPVGEGVSLEGIEVGDLVTFTFVTVWGENYPEYRVTEITELPAETELEFMSGG